MITHNNSTCDVDGVGSRLDYFAIHQHVEIILSFQYSLEVHLERTFWISGGSRRVVSPKLDLGWRWKVIVVKDVIVDDF